MKQITVKLSEKAETYFNDLAYSLPKNEDGTGMATHSQCVNYAMEMAADIEKWLDGDIADLENIVKFGKAQNETNLKINNMNNLELNKQITFDELVKHGLENGANVVDGMPWSWKINGKAITHENNDVYIVETIDGDKHFERGDRLAAFESGLQIFKTDYNDAHSPGGCPM